MFYKSFINSVKLLLQIYLLNTKVLLNKSFTKCLLDIIIYVYLVICLTKVSRSIRIYTDCLKNDPKKRNRILGQKGTARVDRGGP
jgi:hypothetical protein